MINQGLTLTLAGMAFVFSFLILLVLVMSISSGIINRFFSQEAPLPAPLKTNKPDISVAIAVAAAKARKDGKL